MWMVVVEYERAFAIRIRAYGRAYPRLRVAHGLVPEVPQEDPHGTGRRPPWELLRYGTQSAQLKEIRALCPQDARWSFSSQQATLRRLNRAFVAFFKRSKEEAQEPGYPRFKAAHRFD